jgi:hypothetical protein
MDVTYLSLRGVSFDNKKGLFTFLSSYRFLQGVRISGIHFESPHESLDNKTYDPLPGLEQLHVNNTLGFLLPDLFSNRDSLNIRTLHINVRSDSTEKVRTFLSGLGNKLRHLSVTFNDIRHIGAFLFYLFINALFSTE